jgi:hypothetical protein
MPLRSTLVDGELVIDIDRNTRKVCIRIAVRDLFAYMLFLIIGNDAISRL